MARGKRTQTGGGFEAGPSISAGVSRLLEGEIARGGGALSTRSAVRARLEKAHARLAAAEAKTAWAPKPKKPRAKGVKRPRPDYGPLSSAYAAPPSKSRRAAALKSQRRSAYAQELADIQAGGKGRTVRKAAASARKRLTAGWKEQRGVYRGAQKRARTRYLEPLAAARAEAQNTNDQAARVAARKSRNPDAALARVEARIQARIDNAARRVAARVQKAEQKLAAKAANAKVKAPRTASAGQIAKSQAAQNRKIEALKAKLAKLGG